MDCQLPHLGITLRHGFRECSSRLKQYGRTTDNAHLAAYAAAETGGPNRDSDLDTDVNAGKLTKEGEIQAGAERARL